MAGGGVLGVGIWGDFCARLIKREIDMRLYNMHTI